LFCIYKKGRMLDLDISNDLVAIFNERDAKNVDMKIPNKAIAIANSYLMAV